MRITKDTERRLYDQRALCCPPLLVPDLHFATNDPLLYDPSPPVPCLQSTWFCSCT